MNKTQYKRWVVALPTNGADSAVRGLEPAATDPKEILAHPQRSCRLCGAHGSVLHSGLADRQSPVPGVWSFRRCVNRQCDLTWLDPLPLEQELAKAYGDYYTHERRDATAGLFARAMNTMKSGYLASRFGYREGVGALARIAGWAPWLYPGRPPELDLSVMWLEAARTGRLLDIGAGSGWLVENMNALGWNAQGLDVDPVAVSNARERGLNFHQGSVADQHYSEATFDAVTLCHSIEHVSDPVALVTECLRIVKPGGQVIMVTPNTDSLGHRVFGRAWFPLDPPRHLLLFNRRSMTSMITSAGAGRFRIFSTCRDANGIFLASRAIRRYGRFDVNAPRSALDKIAGRVAQTAEILALLAKPWCGEELVAIVEKPRSALGS